MTKVKFTELVLIFEYETQWRCE